MEHEGIHGRYKDENDTITPVEIRETDAGWIPFAVAIVGNGGWGKGATVKEALKNAGGFKRIPAGYALCLYVGCVEASRYDLLTVTDYGQLSFPFDCVFNRIELGKGCKL